jgi:DNA-binding CsgD family transcriptional regulator
MPPNLLQVRELLSRNLTAVEIAHRLHLTVDYVNSAIKILKQKELDCR